MPPRPSLSALMLCKSSGTTRRNTRRRAFDSVYQIPDMPDLFEHFDPRFDLDAIDFVLVQNDGSVALPGSDLSPEESWIYGAEASGVVPDSADRCVSASATTLRP